MLADVRPDSFQGGEEVAEQLQDEAGRHFLLTYFSFATLTTVGYGDQYPVTTGGRLSGIVMLTVGVALFATFSGFLANLFLTAKRSASEPTTNADLAALIGEFERLSTEQQAALDRLRVRVAELDAAT